ncbi:MAG: hypothetical protein GY711_25935 [bacterium]|nr:hypothetical protein [bacterium]
MKPTLLHALLHALPYALLWGLPFALGCSDSDTAAPASSESDPSGAPAASWPPPGDGAESNSGNYYVTWAARPAEVPLNEIFEVDLRIWDAKTRTEIGADADLFVDARMPAHGHGMKHEVELIRNADASVTVEGMLFHMTGHWELYVDLTRGAVTERTQFDVDLE